MKSKLVSIAVFLPLVWAAAARLSSGDVFLLSTGGRIVGECLNPNESPRSKFIIRTTDGSQVTLEASQVKRVVPGDGAELEYERIRPGYADTVEDQWALAEWCRTHRLPQQRKLHLERIIELDPDHAPARHALGYTRHGAQWKIRDEVMQKRGYVRFEGSWRLPQEISLIRQQRASARKQGEWLQKLRRWTRALGGSNDPEARRSIHSIDDPDAVKALIASLTDERAAVRLLLIEVLAKIGTPEALKALAVRSLEDDVEEVRLTCLDALKKHKIPGLSAYYCRALASSDNTRINRAAVALGVLEDRSAVLPLAAALVSTHKQKISRGSPGSLSTSFGTGPGGAAGPAGLSVGGRPRIVVYQVRNQAVLDALVSLTGVNFGFDPQAWKKWYLSQQMAHQVNLRRD